MNANNKRKRDTKSMQNERPLASHLQMEKTAKRSKRSCNNSVIDEQKPQQKQHLCSSNMSDNISRELTEVDTELPTTELPTTELSTAATVATTSTMDKHVLKDDATSSTLPQSIQEDSNNNNVIVAQPKQQQQQHLRSSSNMSDNSSRELTEVATELPTNELSTAATVATTGTMDKQVLKADDTSPTLPTSGLSSTTTVAATAIIDKLARIDETSSLAAAQSNYVVCQIIKN